MSKIDPPEIKSFKYRMHFIYLKVLAPSLVHATIKFSAQVDTIFTRGKSEKDALDRCKDIIDRRIPDGMLCVGISFPPDRC